jgi:phage replication-related protein YjqB (UPF0714/DUF867 family)
MPGVEERLELRSTFGFLAFHGGSLERVTDRIAVEAAEQCGASVYAVVQPPGTRVHLPSIEVTPDASPSLRAFLDHVDVAVAVHGYGRDGLWSTLLLGGRNRALAGHVGARLDDALADHQVCTDLEAMPAGLRGVHRDNPVNRCRGAGVQLELPPGVRGLTPRWATWAGPGLAPPTEAVVTALAEAARTWPAQGASRSVVQLAEPPEPDTRV